MGDRYESWLRDARFKLGLQGYRANHLTDKAQAALERLVTEDIQTRGVPGKLRKLLAEELQTDKPTIARLQADVRAINTSDKFSSSGAFAASEGYSNNVPTRPYPRRR